MWSKVARTSRDAYVDWAAALAAVPRPAVPVTEPWQLSIATLLGVHPRVPGVAVRLLELLDRFGEVTVGPSQIGFDGEDIPWDKVVEIRTHPTATLVPDIAVDKEVDRIRDLLPPVPGRKWVVSKAAECLLTLVMAVTASAEQDDRLVPCEIVYRSVFGRPKELSAGLFAATILGAFPSVGDALIATAEARGIPVNPVANEALVSREQRAQRLRAASDKLTERVRALRAEQDEPSMPALPVCDESRS
jgi:hypothetical protein